MRRERRRRWALVAAVAVTLIAVPAAVKAVAPSSAQADAGHLRTLILRSASQPYQGYAESVGSMALPELPNSGNLTSLLNGKTRLRAWYASPEESRVSVLTAAGEQDIYRTIGNSYSWDYETNLLTQLVGEPPIRTPRAGDLLPPELARRLLGAVPEDPVTPLPSRRVAGIAAPGLRLLPADPATTLGQIDVWADQVTGLPLAVEVTARGQTGPVLTTAFAELRQTRPLLDFPARLPGSGYSVTNAPDIAYDLGALARTQLPGKIAGRELRTGAEKSQGAGVYGSGLAAFVVVAVPRDLGAAISDAAARAGSVPIQLDTGNGQALQISPASLVIVRSTKTRRWFLLAGTVTPGLLHLAATELSGLPR
ncbi:hypothetical protein [Amycolatopsis sp. NPDC059657]|uniref:hypothetical protein n=1 Tax=Amycolatopsis sp. NPDC059657 TaxID=3346899 RepID=UPI0036725E88